MFCLRQKKKAPAKPAPGRPRISKRSLPARMSGAVAGTTARRRLTKPGIGTTAVPAPPHGRTGTCCAHTGKPLIRVQILGMRIPPPALVTGLRPAGAVAGTPGRARVSGFGALSSALASTPGGGVDRWVNGRARGRVVLVSDRGLDLGRADPVRGLVQRTLAPAVVERADASNPVPDPLPQPHREHWCCHSASRCALAHLDQGRYRDRPPCGASASRTPWPYAFRPLLRQVGGRLVSGGPELAARVALARSRHGSPPGHRPARLVRHPGGDRVGQRSASPESHRWNRTAGSAWRARRSS
jgi:hypothetical protein